MGKFKKAAIGTTIAFILSTSYLGYLMRRYDVLVDKVGDSNGKFSKIEQTQFSEKFNSCTADSIVHKLEICMPYFINERRAGSEAYLVHNGNEVTACKAENNCLDSLEVRLYDNGAIADPVGKVGVARVTFLANPKFYEQTCLAFWNPIAYYELTPDGLRLENHYKTIKRLLHTIFVFRKNEKS